MYVSERELGNFTEFSLTFRKTKAKKMNEENGDKPCE
jgi:hypothetical protein